jgi:cob(I)alamin adenosyltransferase
MPRITKVTTRRGDDGKTDLADGGRIRKDSARMQAVGTLDELNSAIGVARSLNPSPKTAGLLLAIQNDLLCLGAMLSRRSAPAGKPSRPAFAAGRIPELEHEIDALQKHLGPLQNFILPGGTPAAAALQLARAVCRRAERDVVTLSRTGRTAPEIRIYLNRLSDLLFQTARMENQAAGLPEDLWRSR